MGGVDRRKTKEEESCTWEIVPKLHKPSRTPDDGGEIQSLEDLCPADLAEGRPRKSCLWAYGKSDRSRVRILALRGSSESLSGHIYMNSPERRHQVSLYRLRSRGAFLEGQSAMLSSLKMKKVSTSRRRSSRMETSRSRGLFMCGQPVCR